MKGFGIEIKNNLLDPKHVQSMGQAVWLYMFLVDKMTSISEEGIGRVLGGRPVKYEEIKTELGISRRTYVRWIAQLLKYPYIETTVAPYGIIFRVLKAYKRFSRKQEVRHKLLEVRHKLYRGAPQTAHVIKTLQDNTKDSKLFIKKDRRGEDRLPDSEFLKKLREKVAPK